MCGTCFAEIFIAEIAVGSWKREVKWVKFEDALNSCFPLDDERTWYLVVDSSC